MVKTWGFLELLPSLENNGHSESSLREKVVSASQLSAAHPANSGLAGSHEGPENCLDFESGRGTRTQNQPSPANLPGCPVLERSVGWQIADVETFSGGICFQLRPLWSAFGNRNAKLMPRMRRASRGATAAVTTPEPHPTLPVKWSWVNLRLRIASSVTSSDRY